MSSIIFMAKYKTMYDKGGRVWAADMAKNKKDYENQQLTPQNWEGLDRRWHLATDDHEISVTELEYSLMRAWEAFCRWQSEGLAAVTGMDMSGGDNAILHVIRLRERAKGLKEIARLVNRDDIPNIQYSLRKLQKAGLIEMSTGGKRKGATYQVTDKGRRVTEDFASLRRKLLIGFTRAVTNAEAELTHASLALDLMTGIYEQAARIAATHRGGTS